MAGGRTRAKKAAADSSAADSGDQPQAKPAAGRTRGKKPAAAADQPEKQAAAGKKRKTADSEAVQTSAAAAGDAADGEQPEQKRRVLLKGRAPVDSECPVASKCHVYDDGETVWDCMLNQTNVGSNNNKYYIIQLLQEDTADKYYVWMRWGRVGFTGQNSLQPCGGNLDGARGVFTRKFQDKTKNAWSARDKFQKVAGKYDLVKIDYAADEPDAKKLKQEAEKKKKPTQQLESKLEAKVRGLIELICNVRLMEETVMEMEYDAKKAPLGKLTEEQIRAGYEALKRIDQLIRDNKKGAELERACSDFYTRIPHSFGMRRPTLIQTSHQVKLKLELLEALGDIQLALKLIGDEDGDSAQLHPADRNYQALQCELTHLSAAHPHHQLVERYLQTTHGHTHSGYRLHLLDLYRVDKDSEVGRFQDHGNRMLLWHGSRLSNWAGILGAGLKIAPPEAPATGYMFGKGIYFADMASKSANYCFASHTKNEGLLLLSEVSLGVCNELINAKYDANKLPKGKHSTKGLGQTAPAPENFATLEDGVVVPLGPGVPAGKNLCLMYNEYIVYDVAQVRMRYLLRVRFDWKF